MKLQLEIEVEYDASQYNHRDYAQSVARQILQSAAEHIAGKGLLTQESNLYVKSWSAQVKKVI